MENSQKALLEVIEDQKKTIEKYANKLRDVVAAHKSLQVEKKALEDTIKILTPEKVTTPNNDCSNEKKISESNDADISETEKKNELCALITSMSTLVAEKSHMEDGYISKQKQLLEDKKKLENKCQELEEEVKALIKQLNCVENKSSTEVSQTKKDFQKIARNSKQTADKDKSKSLENELLALQVKNYEKEIKNLKSELEAKQIVYESSEKKLLESCKELSQLQEDFKNLQIEHEMAIFAEKEKAKSLEEQAKKLTAIQEEKVYNLEARLAELSENIGTYDRLRLQDQIEIQKLKEHITYIDIGSEGSVLEHDKSEELDLNDYNTLKEKFLDVVKKLKVAAQNSNKEEDFKNLFLENSQNEDEHLLYEKKCEKLQIELECFKNEVKNCNQGKSEKVVSLQNQIKSLQKRVKILNDKNKGIVNNYNVQITKLKTNLKSEKERFKQMISALEADHKHKVWLLEEQLQKQRERSLALLEEKDQEIQTLQSANKYQATPSKYSKSEEYSFVEPNLLANNEFSGPHIVHYANELARKDVEITCLRRSKNQIEMSLRELQKKIASTVEKHKKEENSLLNEIARLERYQTRAGANLEYLKNVVYNFLQSDDPKWKNHLCKAIAAVLKFSDTELENVIGKNKRRWHT